MQLISYARHQFPAEIIRHATWLYLRFTLSYRDVEELLVERGIEALSREPERSHNGPVDRLVQAAAVAICHACPASALKSRRVQRETRWR
jgi:transposase-like protein